MVRGGGGTHIQLCVVYAWTKRFWPFLPFDGIRHRYELEPRIATMPATVPHCHATWHNKACTETGLDTACHIHPHSHPHYPWQRKS